MLPSASANGVTRAVKVPRSVKAGMGKLALAVPLRKSSGSTGLPRQNVTSGASRRRTLSGSSSCSAPLLVQAPGRGLDAPLHGGERALALLRHVLQRVAFDVFE